MKKKILFIAMALLMAGSVHAQSQIKIVLGSVYDNGTITINQVQPAERLHGLQTAFLDGSGNGLLTTLVPGNIYSIVTCTSLGTTCLGTTINPTGATQDISSALQAGPFAGSGGGGMVYPGAGVANSTGSAWGTSYAVGTAASDLVQLNGSGQLPAVSAALLTNFPTFNQNTTGSAAKWTTARNLAGNSVDGSADVAFANNFIVQGTTDTGLSGAQFMGALATGIVKNTTSTGVLSIAIASDFPTLNQNTTGNAGTATALASVTGYSIYGSGSSSGSWITPTGNAQCLMSGASSYATTTPSFQICPSGFSNPMTTLGDVIYGGASGAATRLAGPTGPSGVPQYLIDTPASGAAIAETFAPAGVVPNAQTGTTYTFLATDRTGYTTFSNGSSIAVTLPAAGGTGFASNYVTLGCDIGAGTATITPTTSTISYSNPATEAYTSGASTMTLATGQCAFIYSDNTNYFALKFGNPVTGTGSTVLATSPNLVTPALGAASATSLLASGIVDGTAPITITTGTTANLGGTYNSGYTFNQEATAGTGVTYTLPATAVGQQYCVKNSGTTGVINTGVLTVYPPSGSYMILNGTVNTIGGGGTHGVASGGAAGDGACFVAIDSTHWSIFPLSGTWTLN